MESRWQWIIGGVGAAIAAVSGWRLRAAKTGKVKADERWTNLRSMSRIIRELNHELGRLRADVIALRAQNAEQAAEMLRDRQECDENHRKLQAEINRLKDQVRVLQNPGTPG